MSERTAVQAIRIASILLVSLVAVYVLPVNLWSVEYMHLAMSGGEEPITLRAPPSGHKRGGLWQARYALQIGDAGRVEHLLADLVAQGNPEALSLLAEAKNSEGEFADAVRIWTLAKDAVSLRQVAEAASSLGRLDDALLAYRSLRQVDPQVGTTALAEFLWWPYGDYDAMELILREALFEHPDSSFRSTWLRLLGDALSGQERWLAAESSYRRALIDEPGDALAHISLGMMHHRQGKGLDVAVNEILFGVQLKPNEGTGHFTIGQIMEDEGFFEEAETWYKQALERNPERRWWYLARASNAIQAGDLQLALEIYQEVVSTFPDFGEAHFDLACAYWLAGKPLLAQQALEKALELRPLLVDWQYEKAAEIFEWAGQPEASAAADSESTRVNPDGGIGHSDTDG